MAGSRYDGARRSRQRAHADAPRRWAEKSLSRRQMRPLRFLADGIGFLALGLLAVLGGMSLSPTIRALLPPAIAEIRMVAATPVAVAQHFSLCGLGSRINCVVDGDTFYYRGEKIRLADVNTPEVSEPKCATEARLGAAATRRLQSLLNAGRSNCAAARANRTVSAASCVRCTETATRSAMRWLPKALPIRGAAIKKTGAPERRKDAAYTRRRYSAAATISALVAPPSQRRQESSSPLKTLRSILPLTPCDRPEPEYCQKTHLRPG